MLTCLALAPVAVAQVGPAEPAGGPIVIGSKPFPESRLLAEMFAQHLEQRGFRVERKLALGATAVLFEALRTGAIDVYPEYTGTGLMAIMKAPPDTDPDRVLRRVTKAFEDRWGIRWLPPLGFENTYAIAVRRETATRHKLETLSDLTRAGPQLTGGFSPDFKGRPDGLPGLAKAYGLKLKAARAMDPALKYRALAEGAVDVVDGYSTDGEIARLGLKVLRDDKQFFPPYYACALVAPRVAKLMPEAMDALHELSGRIDATTMRGWNSLMGGDQGRAVPEMARAALTAVGLGPDVPMNDIARDDTPPVAVTGEGGAAHRVWKHTLEHLAMVLVALLFGCVIAIPLGVWIERAGGAAEWVVKGTGVLQTVPSLALLALMIPLLGIGFWPAIVALFLYSLYPIVRATYTGVRNADPAAVAAATALGMDPGQVLRLVRLPLAAPFIMAGVRTAAVITVGTATLATYIGAGGLGEPIQEGLSMLDNRLILMGAIPAALLALIVDGALALVERAVKPRGV